MIRVQAERFDAADEAARLMRRASGSGAMVSFVGLVRDSGHDGSVVELELEYHPTFTLKRIEAIGDEAIRRFRLAALSIIHRHGKLRPGEPIVFVGAVGKHRRSAFDAVDCVMDILKVDAPFWKREHGSEQSRWIEPDATDVAERMQWDDIAETENARA